MQITKMAERQYLKHSHSRRQNSQIWLHQRIMAQTEHHQETTRTSSQSQLTCLEENKVKLFLQLITAKLACYTTRWLLLVAKRSPGPTHGPNAAPRHFCQEIWVSYKSFYESLPNFVMVSFLLLAVKSTLATYTVIAGREYLCCFQGLSCIAQSFLNAFLTFSILFQSEISALCAILGTS